MSKKICILPCNGIDKTLGVIARHISFNIIEKNPNVELICPVLLHTGDKKYEEILKNSDIMVVDGCMTRCATKLIDQRAFKIKKKIFLPDLVKKYQIKLEKSLKLNKPELEFAENVASEILDSLKKSKELEVTVTKEMGEIEYFETIVDKFHFKVPKNGYFFNENDCWMKPEGNKALIGVSDFLQRKVGDIIMVELPQIGQEIGQFDDVGNIESVKTVIQIISPGAGKIMAVNKELEKSPELMNQDPYGKGWFAELELINFEEDKELLMDGLAYFNYMQKKIAEEQKQMKERYGV